MFVVDGLVGLAPVTLFGVAVLVGGVGVGAVLRQADDHIGVLLVELVKPRIVLFQLPQIPAEIQVVTADVRQLDKGVVHIQHKGVGHRRGAGGVQLVAQVVENPVVLHHIGGHTARGRDLVGQPPADDGRVVVVLHDQLGHLADRVGPAVFHVFGDVGDFGPDDQAVLVAQVVEVLGVLIVCQAHGVGAHLAQQGHVLLVLGVSQCTAQTLAVLVAGCAAEPVDPAVEQKALVRVKPDGTAAVPDADAVATVQAGRDGVEVRVLDAVPQVDVFQREHSARVAVFDRGGEGLPGGKKGNTRGLARDPGFHRDGGGAGVEVHGRRHLEPRAAVIIERKVCGGHGDQVHRPVQPTVKGEVGFLGVDGVILAVVHEHSQQVVPGAQRGGQFHPEGRIPARMPGQLPAV